jgi:hypothetical protein
MQRAKDTFVEYQAIPGDMIQSTSSATKVSGDRCVCRENYVLAKQIGKINALLQSVITVHRDGPWNKMPATIQWSSCPVVSSLLLDFFFPAV